MSDDSTAETTQSFAPKRVPDAPAEKTSSFAPRPAEPPGETTQSFAPSPASTPQSLQWNAPGASPAPSFTPDGQGATSPVPGPLATASFAPAHPAQPTVSFSPPETPAVEAAPDATPLTPPVAVEEPEPAESPSFPRRPSTLVTGGVVAAIQGVALVAGGAVIVVLANGSGDWLQKRLDDWNSSHSATSLDAFKHAADVAGLGAVAFGLVVLLLAGSSLLYGQSSRLALTGAEVLLIAVAALGVVVSPLSLVFALGAIVVIALILAPQTSRAFHMARDAEEEWRATL